MKLYDEIVAKIAFISNKAIADKNEINRIAAVKIQELQEVLDSNAVWLQVDTQVFQTKINRVVTLLRN